jgi:uncharacterized protein YcfJ
LKVGSLDGL